MKLDDIIAAWNSQADEHNQWSDLGEDEKVEFAYRLGRAKTNPYEQLRAFARDVMRYWPESDVEGGNLQSIAARHGLLTAQIMFAPCDDYCSCADVLGDDEFAEGITCYRKVDWLVGSQD